MCVFYIHICIIFFNVSLYCVMYFIVCIFVFLKKLTDLSLRMFRYFNPIFSIIKMSNIKNSILKSIFINYFSLKLIKSFCSVHFQELHKLKDSAIGLWNISGLNYLKSNQTTIKVRVELVCMDDGKLHAWLHFKM